MPQTSQLSQHRLFLAVKFGPAELLFYLLGGNRRTPPADLVVFQ